MTSHLSIKRFFILLLAISGAALQAQQATVRAPAASATTVLPAQQREVILTRTAAIMDLAQPGFMEALREHHDPFFDIVVPPPVVEKKDEPVKKPVPVERPRMSDQAILEQVRPTLSPRGMLVRGERRVVLLARGPVAEGDFIPATADGRSVEIYIEDVTTDSFVLRLNETRMLVHFSERALKGQIIRDN